MFWILLLVLTVVGGASAVGIAMRSGRKQLATGGAEPRALPGGTDLERGIRDLRVDDVLTMDGKDFLVEGLIAYDEDGHRWIAGRIVDGSDVAWLLVGIERTAAQTARVLRQDDATSIAGYPPEAIVIGDIRFVLDKRGAATCQLHGDVGALGGATTKRPEPHVERCRWWLYAAPGEDALVVEQWGADYRVLRGRKVVDGTVELIPGS